MSVNRAELEWLSRILGLEGQQVERVSLDEKAHELHLWLKSPPGPYICPLCGKSVRSLHDRRERAVRDKPWADNSVWVHVPVLRIRCCQGATPIELPLAVGIKKNSGKRPECAS
jgi:transposase